MKVLVVVSILLLGGLGAYVLTHRQGVDQRVLAYKRVGEAYNEGRDDEARLLAGRYLEDYGENGDIRMLLGLAAFRTGRKEEGIADVRRALAKDPGLFTAALFLADQAFRAGRQSEAVELAERALKASPSRTLPLAHYILGKIRSRSETLDVTGAIRHLEVAVAGDLSDRYRPDAYLTLSRLYGIRESADPDPSERPASAACLDRAREAYEKMLQVDPGNGRYLVGLARCAYSLGQYGAALAHLRQLEAAEAETPPVQVLRWMCHWKLGNDEAADAAWREFAQGDPEPSLLMEAAAFYRSVGREDLAVRVLERAREAHAGYGPLVLSEAARHMSAGRFGLAEAILEKAAGDPGADPDVVLAWLNSIRAQPGRDAEAEGILRERCASGSAARVLRLSLAETLLDTPPSRPGWRERLDEAQAILQPGGAEADGAVAVYLQFLRGKLMYRRGWLADAGGLLLDLVSRKPDEARAHLLLADVRAEQDRPEDEVRALNTAIRLLGPRPGLLLRRGQAHLASSGGAESARRDAEQVLAADPGNEGAYILLAKGFLAQDPPDEEEAIRQLLRGARVPEASGSARLLLGRVYLARDALEPAQEQYLRVSREARAPDLRLEATSALASLRNMGADSGVSDAARRTYESFIEQNPDQVEARIRYANMLVENGEQAAAKEWLQKVISDHPRNVEAYIILFEISLAAADEVDRAGALAALAEVEKLEPDGPEIAYLRGRLALLDEDLDKAIADLRSAAQRAPRNARVAYHLGAAEFLNEEIIRARQSLEKALRLDPRNLKARVLLADISYQEGRKLVEGGNESTREEALRRFRYALEQNPGHLGSLAYIVGSFFSTGSAGNSVEIATARRQTEVLLRRIEAIHSVHPDPAVTERLAKTLRLFGAICYVQQDWEAVTRSCRRCLELTPDDSGALLRMGLALMASGQTGDAVGYVRRARDATPGSWPVLATLTELLLSAGRPEEAVMLLEEWSGDRPDDARAALLLGRVHLAAGNLDPAVRCFENCLRLDADFLEAADALASLQAGRGKGGDAEAAIRAILPGSTRKGEMKFILGRLMLGRDLTAGTGIDTLRAALRDGISDPDFHVGCNVLLLRALVAAERFPDAVGVARRFADWHRKNGPFDLGTPGGRNAPEAFSLGGVALARTGMRDLAESFYREAVKLSPEFAQALNNLAAFLGDAPRTERAAKLDEMLELARRAVKLVPEEPAYHDTLGSALLLAGKLQDAITSFQKSLELCRKLLDAGVIDSHGKALQRQIARSWLHLAVAFFDAGRLQESREALRRATTEDPALGNEEAYLEAAARIGL